ncbi:craniofacial development protein 2-like [Temnothorax longispinosus]|uniref:craniofacial development protein 2-like n=1 Tax=Temnothorax longispinosus TaxID=300112 RepID=UPI003A9A52F8
MSNSKTKLPQASRAERLESRTDTSVCLMDSGGGTNSMNGRKRKRNAEHKRTKKTLYIASYNIRTMRLEEHLINLENKLENIKWDVLGISETRLSGEAVTIMKSGHMLLQKNSDIDSHIRGVALLIHKKLKHLVTKTKAISDRVIYVVLRLNNKCSIQIIQAYAPTSASTEEDIEQFYEDLTAAKSAEKTKFTIITDNFNAKIGAMTQADPPYIGVFGLGTKNPRGQEMMDFLCKEKIYCLNTFFKKHPRRKLTWRSPDSTIKNEIDYVLATDKRICADVSTLNRFDTGSDHRLVRAKVLVDTRLERKRLMNKKVRPTLAELRGKEEEYKTTLEQKLKPTEKLQELELNALSTQITNSIRSAVRKVCSLQKRGNSKLSPDIERQIRERRRTSRDSPVTGI